MQLKAKTGYSLERLRGVIWLLVLITLLMSFILMWQRIEQQANRSALQLVSQRITERASFYKQQWLLAKQPRQLELGQLRLNYTNMGWVKPINTLQQPDCQYWLEVLYPEQEIMGTVPTKIVNESIAGSYRCLYLYSEDRFVAISLIKNDFSARSGFLVE
ncbi:MSHA biogenesis protein MshF [Vibrio sp. JPW-9-11-11]|uniref:MSHA biogenesis protein MshF n=1 Tax=Vibrio sp. JPW-9-11-11 TaxID=1416532 RepID=UPI001593E28E|nr:MSHA biogenesis protein MshF [Vibrio sp. JPW-9-11-11]NVD07585.1 MSHA biogenesis protein MshF [Vibrio sp. JPW-9-11-11]